jgi:putative addiction module component (TIGR02574 family)
LRQRYDGLDRSPFREQVFVMSSAAVKRVIDLASELSEDERRVVVDAIAPRESVASLADEWTAEIERRANLVRSGRSEGKPADEVFDRLESMLKAR